MTLFIKLLIVLICMSAGLWLLVLALKERRTVPSLTFLDRLKLAFTGFVANMADTLGIGSFAVVVAFDKFWKLVDDQKLPGTLNAQSALPAMCQALFFLQAVQVEVQTLVALLIGACIGGLIGGLFVSKLDKQRIRLFMLLGYLGIAVMIIASKLGLLPVGGDLMGLHGTWLFIGVLGMIVAGMLPAIGVGAYALTQVILFLLGMSPLAAFPIMTASGAIQQTFAGLVFIKRKQVVVKPSLIMGLAGIGGVLVIAPMITFINPENLRWLLLAVVLYNIHMLWKSFLRRAPVTQAA